MRESFDRPGKGAFNPHPKTMEMIHLANEIIDELGAMGLGDHDPSGVDMTRDVTDRLNMFLADYTGEELEVQRVALNIPQIKRYNPPPNPAKDTDSRFKDYRRKHGENCWELDALNPQVIDKLITDTILEYRDDDLWNQAVEEEETHRRLISDCAVRWADVEKFLLTPPKPRRARKANKKKK